MGLRILFLQHPGTNSRDIFFDIIEGYEQAGHEVFVFELAPLWTWTERDNPEEIKDACVRVVTDTVICFAADNRIDLCVCMWANGVLMFDDGSGRSAFEQAGLPILMHWLDAPHWAHGGTVLDYPAALFNGPRSFHVINNPGTAKELEGVLGFSNVLAVANAASPTVFRPEPTPSKDFDIVFAVGADQTKPTEIMLSELAKDEPDMQAIRAVVAAGLRPRLLDIAGPPWQARADAEHFVDAMIAARLACRDEPVLEQIGRLVQGRRELATGALKLLQDAPRYVQFSMALRGMDDWERAFVFAYLSRYFRCACFGLQRPFTHWPGNWEYLGSLPYREQCRAYGRGRFGLNVMRWQDDVGLNLKPFEVTLSGACLLQSYRVGIESLFGEGEAVVFRSPQECRRKVADLLAIPGRIEQIAAAGRARSLAEHCWKHRAAEVVAAITPRLGRRVAPPP